MMCIDLSHNITLYNISTYILTQIIFENMILGNCIPVGICIILLILLIL